MAKFKVILFLMVLPYALSQCTKQKAKLHLTRATYDFNYELVTRIAQSKENHFVTSTLSIWELITTVALGAEHETLKQIKSVLKIHTQPCFNKRYEEILNDVASEGARNAALQTSAAMFVDDTLAVKKDFMSKVKRRVTDVFTPSFTDINEAAENINSYVSEKTHNSITDIVTPEDLHNKYLILINAIYFKANWKLQFDTRNTVVKTFMDEVGTPLGETNMMFRSDDFKSGTLGNLRAQVLELPYVGDTYSMLIILPDRGTKLTDLIESMKNVNVKSVFKSLGEPSKLSVSLPRFSIDSDLDNLPDLLKDMGLTYMFSEAASFPYISDYKLYVSDLIQKARVVVTEEGTVAVAASKLDYEDRAAPPDFTASRPFLFLIVENSYKLVLFTGAYSKPSLY